MIYFKRAVWLGPAALTGLLGLALGFGSLPVAAQAVMYEVSNYTSSGGDPVNTVTDDVLFTNLTLTETFADSTTRVDTLFDSSNTAQTSLDAFQFLDSNFLLLSNAGSSPVVSAILTGKIFPPLAADGNGNFTLNTQTDAFDPSTAGTATVGPSFSATLTDFTPGSAVEIFAQNPNGTASANGLGTLAISAAVPETSTWVSFGLLLSLGGLTLVTSKRRKNANTH